MSQQLLHSWTFPEYTGHQKQASWYIWASLIFIALLAFAILTANFLFGLIIIISTIIIFSYHYKQPRNINFQILDDGIIIDNKQYPYKSLKKFWLVYDPPAVKNLYFQQNGLFNPTLVISLQNQNPVEIRQTLKKYLTEDLDKEDESNIEALSRILKI